MPPCGGQAGGQDIRKELLDELLKEYDGIPHAPQGPGRGAGPAGRGSGNSRNGKSKKTVQGESGAIELEIPRDRQSEFEPQLVRKGQTRLAGLDEKSWRSIRRG